MATFSSLSILASVFLFSVSFSLPTPKPFNADDYLARFGYLQTLPEPRSQTDLKEYQLKKEIQKKEAIRVFQRFANLPETGKIDDKTKEKMLAPRCGISDLDGLKRDSATKWEKSQLKWTVKQYTSQLSEGDVRRAVAEALGIWSKVVPLDFVEVNPDSDDAEIQVKFASGRHDDPYPFDGTGRTLAHAFYPKDGRVHFDDDERWSYDDKEKIEQGYLDFLVTATHELGHTLGLAHTRTSDAVMAPFYQLPPTGKVELAEDDIRRVQNIYGARAGSKSLGRPNPVPVTTEPRPVDKKPTTPPPRVPNDRGSPDKRCPTRIDAATTAMDGRTYFFAGNIVWRQDENGKLSDPKYVDQLFPRGPSSGVTAAVTNEVSQLTVLFQGRKVYAFEWSTQSNLFVLRDDFPKDLTNEVEFIPRNSFRWTDGNVVLSNGDDFVTYDEYWNKATFKNKISNYFTNLPSSADKIFNWRSNIVVIRGNKYLTYNGDAKKLGDEVDLKEMLKC